MLIKKQPTFVLSRSKSLFLVLGVIAASIALAIVVIGRTSTRIVGDENLQPSAITDIQTPRDKFRRDHNMHVETISIGPSGFSPSSINRPPGRFLLAINNRSGLHEVDLSLIAEDGKEVLHLKINRRSNDWRGFLHLPPGRYVLTERNNQDWNCSISIGAH